MAFLNRIRTLTLLPSFGNAGDIVILLSLSFMPLSKWFVGSGFFYQLDITSEFTPYGFLQQISANFYVWDSGLQFGRDLSSAGFLFIATMWSIPSFIGLSPELIEKTVVFLVFATASYSTYLLTVYLTSNDRGAGLLSALVYVYNPWLMDRLIWGHFFVLVGYALTPMVLFLYAKSLNQRSIKHGIVGAIIFANLLLLEFRSAYLTLIAITLYSLVFVADHRHSRKEITRALLSCIKLGSLFLVTGLLLNMHLFLPSVVNLQNEAEHIFTRSSVFTLEDLTTYSQNATLDNVLRLRRYSFPYFTEMEKSLVSNPTWYFLTFLEAILALCALFYYKRKKAMPFFLLLMAVSAILSMGTNAPLNIYKWLYLNIPLFNGLRDSNKNMALLSLSFAYLIGATASLTGANLFKKLIQGRKKQV